MAIRTAYEVVMPYHLHMPSYFLGTFTEYPYVDAYDESEAEAIGVTMLENGELDCAGQICAAATAVLV